MPKSGKSTLLKKLIAGIPNRIGFVTNEVLGESGRVGFEIETHSGNKGMLAHVDFKTPIKVSRYFVDTESLDAIIPRVSDFDEGSFLYLDEIGQMELYSEGFKKLALRYLDSSNKCLATLSEIYQDGFTDAIRKRDDVILVELSPENREEKEAAIRKLIDER